MTDKPTEVLPAVREPTRLDELARLGRWLAASEGGNPDDQKKIGAAALRFYYLEELGLPPLAITELSVINGRLFVSAQLLRALAARQGYRVIRENDNDQTCTAVLMRDGERLGQATFTIEQAEKAKLKRPGSVWETHPARMLWARASKNVIVDYAPAVALGFNTNDEIVEIAGEEYADFEAAESDEEAVLAELEQHTAAVNDN